MNNLLFCSVLLIIIIYAPSRSRISSLSIEPTAFNFFTSSFDMWETRSKEQKIIYDVVMTKKQM